MKLFADFSRRWLVFVLLALTPPVWAADLSEAKSGGVIGERADGYLGFVTAEQPADVVALVNEVNAKRRAEYERIAAQNGLSRTQVEALAGKKAIGRSASGHFVFQDGSWRRK